MIKSTSPTPMISDPTKQLMFSRLDWRNWSLFWKLVSAITLLVIIFVVSLTLFSIERERANFRAELQSQAQTFLEILTATSIDQIFLIDVDQLEATAARTIEHDEILIARFYDDTGRILAAPDDELFTVSLEPDIYGQQLVSSQSVIYDWDDDRLIAGQPVIAARTTIGAIHVELSTTRLDQRIADLQQQGLVIGLIAISFGILMAALISRTIANPIIDLAKTATDIANGSLDKQAPVYYQDEVGNLATTFNNMTKRLAQREIELVTVNDSLNEQIKNAEAARQEAERSNQVKSAFLASMSHELRTPLNSVINFSKFLERKVMGPINERQEDMLKQIIASGEHLLSLINDVLDMSKIESGAMKLFIEENVDISEIIGLAVQNTSSLLVDKSVEISTDIQNDLPLISADRKRILQIILNIVSNACKFTTEGHIKIKAHQQDEHIYITIIDTGPGISETDQDKIFDSFKQAESGLTYGEGTGLGMPISKNLAEAHGGKLWFESTIGSGTTFFLTLPFKAKVTSDTSIYL